MHKSHVVQIALCTFLASGSAAARGAVAVTNMAASDATQYDLHSARQATSFTTGAMPAVLSSIRVPYFSTSSSISASGGVWSDAAGHPGAPLESYPVQSFPNLPPGTGTLTFSSAGLGLAADTTYWFVFDNGSDTFWVDTRLAGETSDYGWSIGDHTLAGTFVAGSGWFPGGTAGSVGRMEVDATIVPEPATLTLAALPAGLALLGRRRRLTTPA